LKETIMKEETSYALGPPPVFYGQEYKLWAARMTTHLEVLDLWKKTMAQMKNHKERKTRKAKAKNYLFSDVSKIHFY